MNKILDTVIVTTSTYEGEKTLEAKFLDKLQDVIDGGGQIISIVEDGSRYKKAYVVRQDAE